jgi:hypothetical protein
MDATAFMNAIFDKHCPDNVENGVYTFSIELHCRTVEVTAKKLAEGKFNRLENTWVSGGWEIISFTSR